MPKMKTHTGMAKRVKVTGTGKLMRQQAGMRHHLEVQVEQGDPPPVARRAEVAKADVKRVKKLLGR